MTGLEGLKKLAAQDPNVLKVLDAFVQDLVFLTHPNQAKAEDTADIEERLDEDYKEIIRNNRQSTIWTAIDVLVSKAILEASARAGIRLK